MDRVRFDHGARLRSADLAELFRVTDGGLAEHVRSAHRVDGVLLGLRTAVDVGPLRTTVTVLPGVAMTHRGDLLVLQEQYVLTLGTEPATVVLRAVGDGPQARPWLLHRTPDPTTEVVLGRFVPGSPALDPTAPRTAARRPGTTHVLTGRLSHAAAVVSGLASNWSATVTLPQRLSAPPAVLTALGGPTPPQVLGTTVEVTDVTASGFTLRTRHVLPTGSVVPLTPVTTAPVDIIWTAVTHTPPAAVGPRPSPASAGDAPLAVTSAVAPEGVTTMSVGEPVAPLPAVTRPVFFEQQVLTAPDLNRLVATEQALRELHHRTLHGWGIGSGMEVTGAVGQSVVTVAAGYALDIVGRELLLTEAVELDVPAVAGRPGGGAEEFCLTVRRTEDAEAAVRQRQGSCGSGGAVRLADDPTLQWLPVANVRAGYDVVLATVLVRDCRLVSPPGSASRRQVPVPPHVATGTTPAGQTEWHTVKNDAGAVTGVSVQIDTSAAGFGAEPSYLVRLDGERRTHTPGASPQDCLLDGTPYVSSADGKRITVIVPLVSGVAAADPAPAVGPGVITATATVVPVNPVELLDDNLPGLVRTQLSWHVSWVGVEN
ncbi:MULTISPECIES: hypothetical protein [Streptomyces]|uniref:Uncharacterized protein n=2 Tax=Streptomyces TaxID=1883 RepID=A0ABU4K1M4_9ACTN|nr:hypothetical protein [Streptomyces roseolus]MDX2291651.1 hypothetical protein [Streptomyces roseolus]